MDWKKRFSLVLPHKTKALDFTVIEEVHLWRPGISIFSIGVLCSICSLLRWSSLYYCLFSFQLLPLSCFPFLLFRSFPPYLSQPHTEPNNPALSIPLHQVCPQLSSFSSLNLTFLVPPKLHISYSVILPALQYWLALCATVFLYMFYNQNPAELA